jgi:hypothetical protein
LPALVSFALLFEIVKAITVQSSPRSSQNFQESVAFDALRVFSISLSLSLFFCCSLRMCACAPMQKDSLEHRFFLSFNQNITGGAHQCWSTLVGAASVARCRYISKTPNVVKTFGGNHVQIR